MVTLYESVNIPVAFEKLNEWADNFEEEFVKWSPLHLECELYDKGIRKGDRGQEQHNKVRQAYHNR